MNLFDELARVAVSDPNNYRFSFKCPDCEVTYFVGWHGGHDCGTTNIQCLCSNWTASDGYIARQKMPSIEQ